MADEWTGLDLADEATGALRDKPPDPLAVPDPDAPVSGHHPPRETTSSAVDAPEHDWAAAQSLVFPILRAVGTIGAPADVPLDLLRSSPTSHTTPLVADGPCGLVVSFTLAGGGFDVLVNGEHLLSWGIDASELAAVAGANLAAWSADAPWTTEGADGRHLMSSDTGSGHDAARILLDAARAHVVRELSAVAAPGSRYLVGLPDRDMLVVGTLAPDDAEFAGMFHDFVLEQSGGADEPIERQVFELVGGDLVVFNG
ncbi:MAG TPA: hypothetical protein VIF84_02845 [Candidatus Limnocylindrales bacterium]